MGIKEFKIHEIGQIKRGADITIQLKEEYRKGLLKAEEFSHINVLWWVNGHDKKDSRSICVTDLPYAENTEAGVFACRSEYRPNPIAVTVCPVKKIDREKGILTISNIDAFDGSPVLDIKPYIPVCDRVEKFRIPDWFKGWPEWLPEDGLGLEY